MFPSLGKRSVYRWTGVLACCSLDPWFIPNWFYKKFTISEELTDLCSVLRGIGLGHLWLSPAALTYWPRTYGNYGYLTSPARYYQTQEVSPWWHFNSLNQYSILGTQGQKSVNKSCPFIYLFIYSLFAVDSNERTIIYKT